MKHLGILLSGRGSNFEAIAHNIATGRIPDARIAVVISNKPDAGGIATAQRLGLNTLIIPSKGTERADHDRAVVAALKQHQVDLVCLAGYMRLLSSWFVQQFPRREGVFQQAPGVEIKGRRPSAEERKIDRLEPIRRGTECREQQRPRSDSKAGPEPVHHLLVRLPAHV